MDSLKYIVDEYDNITIFSPTATHSDVARTMHGKPISAGFIRFTTDKFDEPLLIECYGESVSLKLKSREHIDSQIMYKTILKQNT